MLTMIVKNSYQTKAFQKTRPVSAFLLAGLEYSYKGYKTIKLEALTFLYISDFTDLQDT